MNGIYNTLMNFGHDGYVWGRRIVWLLLGISAVIFFFAPNAAFLSADYFGFPYFVMKVYAVFLALLAIDVYFRNI